MSFCTIHNLTHQFTLLPRVQEQLQKKTVTNMIQLCEAALAQNVAKHNIMVTMIIWVHTVFNHYGLQGVKIWAQFH